MTVLLADEIKRLCQDPSQRMIVPFRPSQLRPASYQLTLGEQIHVGGEDKRLNRTNGIILEPHQVAVVCTREKLRIPRDIIARWSIRVRNIYEGLLWTGGPQVDPGWEGPLFCPIYNLAERTVVLKYGEPMFTIDFTRTTELGDTYRELKQKHEYSRIWFTPRPDTTLAEHDRHRLHSAPYEALRELRELRYFRNIGYAAITLILLVLTFMVAALSVVAAKETVKLETVLPNGWPMYTLVIVASLSVISTLTGCYIFWRLRKLL